MTFKHLGPQTDFLGYPHAFAIPGHAFSHSHVNENSKAFWAGVRWCQDQLGEENQGNLYHSGTWTISAPQVPRILFRDAEAAFAFKMRWC